MRIALARNWWSLVIRGIVGIGLGVITFLWPGMTFTALVILFGAYSFLDGVMSLVGAVKAAEADDRWGILVFEGVIGIAVAAVTLLWPNITALALLFVIGAWAIVTGAAEIVAAIRLRKHIAGEWLLALAGVASAVFGVLVMLVPLAGALVIALWVGAYAFVFGIMLAALGFKLRNWQHRILSGPPLAAPAH
jgi:uncharacterized membrane protein HdeD (DUF308 family)